MVRRIGSAEPTRSRWSTKRHIGPLDWKLEYKNPKHSTDSMSFHFAEALPSSVTSHQLEAFFSLNVPLISSNLVERRE